jgi:septal ring factor EnvC (AmiA/AmiB activator)
MDADETAELLDELESLRRRVAELSEAVADARARRIHQDSVIARLRQELQAARAGRPPPC